MEGENAVKFWDKSPLILKREARLSISKILIKPTKDDNLNEIWYSMIILVC